MSYRFVFGPVLSSRLGRSLGLDLLEKKICSFDCLYCEVGPTPERTVKRGVYAPTELLLRELAHWREHHEITPDYVTLGGSGEPCLHSEMGRIITEVRNIVPGVPVAVLTNASLMSDPQVRRELALADAVLPSLDTLVPKEFQRCNRPHPDISLQDIKDGLLAFRNEFKGRIFLEVLLCAQLNDSNENLALLREFVRQLQPDRVDVTTLSRPGAYAGGKAADAATLQRFRQVLEPLAHGADAQRTIASGNTLVHNGDSNETSAPEAQLAEEVYQSLRRRPQTVEQLAHALQAPGTGIENALSLLRGTGRVVALHAAPQSEPVFYKAV